MLLLTIVLFLTAVLDQSLGAGLHVASELGAPRERPRRVPRSNDLIPCLPLPSYAAPGATGCGIGKEVKAKREEEEEDEEEEDEKDENENENEDGSGVSLKAQKTIIDKHNEIRRMVEPPAANMLKVMWNETVGKNALSWAERCILANSPVESRKLGDMDCGETIYQSNQVTPWKEVIEFWMNGKKDFEYDVGARDPRKNIFAYTQLIWYNSYIVGCAAAHCPDISFPFVYVCQYCPRGNLMNQIPKPYKEGQSCADCPKNCDDKLCTNPCKYNDIILNCKELKEVFSCKKKILVDGCKATCRCNNHII